MTLSEPQTKDISPAAALVMLGLVVGFFIYVKAPTTVSRLMAQFDSYGDEHMGFLSVLLVSLCVNFMWVYSLFSLGLNRQGKRLEILTGKKTEKKKLGDLRRVGVTFVAIFALSFFIFSYFDLLPTFLGPVFKRNFGIFAGVNLALSHAILARYISICVYLKKIFQREDVLLPPMPVLINSIVIGTTGEENEAA